MSTRYGTSDYNFMTTKPADNDGMGIFNTAGNQLKTITFATLKNLFVMKDEAANITANHEVQSNYSLNFGNSAESLIIYNGTDMIIGPTAAASTAKLKLQCNAADFLVLDPVNSSINIGTKAINYDGTAGVGLNFDSSNRPVLLSILQMNAGIATKTKNISYNGAAATGLSFDSSSNGTFAQDLNITGQLNANKTGSYALQTATGGIAYFRGNIKTDLNYISNNGTDTGFYMNASNQLTAVTQINAAYAGSYSLQAEGKCYFKDNLRIAGNYISYDGTDNGIYLNNAHKVFMSGDLDVVGAIANGSSGISSAGSCWIDSTFRGSHLILKHGESTPATMVNWARIWVDSSKNVKIKHSDGTTQTFTVS